MKIPVEGASYADERLYRAAEQLSPDGNTPLRATVHDYFDTSFDEALATAGLPRAIDLSRHLPFLSPFQEEFAAISERGENLDFIAPPPKYRFCVLADPTLNACVFRHDGEYIIAINVELVFRCQILANHLFANKSFFTEIGDLAAEEEFIAMPPFDPMNFGANDRAAEVHPRCPIRQEAGNVLSSLMLSFIVSHEKYHVLRGHVDYARSRGASGVTEASSDIKKLVGTHQEFRVAQEFDADRSAVMGMTRIVLNWPDGVAEYRNLDIHNTRTKSVALAAYCVMGLLEPWTTTHHSDSFLHGYPPLSVRRMNVIFSAVIAKLYKPDQPAIAVEFLPILQDIINEGPVVYSVVRNAESPPWMRGHQGAPSASVQKTLDDSFFMCLDLWRQYADRHQPFAYVSLKSQ